MILQGVSTEGQGMRGRARWDDRVTAMTDLESGVENEVNPERRRQMKRKLGGAGPGVFLRSKSYFSVTEVKG